MRHVLQPGHIPRPLHEYATKKSWPHCSHRALTAEVLAEMLEQGYFRIEEAFLLMVRILYLNGKELFCSNPTNPS